MQMGSELAGDDVEAVGRMQRHQRRSRSDVEGLKNCLADFKKDINWEERLDITKGLGPDIMATIDSKNNVDDNSEVNAEDDFQREMCFYRQAQAAILEALPRLHKLKIPTKRPEDYFAEMAKSDQHMQKVRAKLLQKQQAMERSEKAKKLRELRKYGKKVQVQVLQKRQKEKKAMMTAVKKYQKGKYTVRRIIICPKEVVLQIGMVDKLDFLEGDAERGKKNTVTASKSKSAMNMKGSNAKRKYKDKKFGFGGKKRGSKWNTKESYDDVSGFRSKVAHGKVGGMRGKGGKKAVNLSQAPYSSSYSPGVNPETTLEANWENVQKPILLLH
ncbi:EBP2 protein, partial [Polypterus senegalus]